MTPNVCCGRLSAYVRSNSVMELDRCDFLLLLFLCFSHTQALVGVQPCAGPPHTATHQPLLAEPVAPDPQPPKSKLAPEDEDTYWQLVCGWCRGVENLVSRLLGLFPTVYLIRGRRILPRCKSQCQNMTNQLVPARGYIARSQ
jgi:hypothetical protein